MIKRKGVLAVPGEYTKGDEKYNKSAEELKEAVLRFPIIPLTYGHLIEGTPTPEEQIGTVSQRWCEKTQKVLGEFWFHEEKIPEVLRKKLDNGERIPISAGYDAYVDEDKNQSGLSYTHIAVLDGESPVCPIEKCGIFERLPFTEQLDDLTPPEPKAEKEPEVAPPVEEEPVTTEETPIAEEPKPDPPVEQKPEEPDEQATKEEVRLEPEVVIPIESSVVQKVFDVIDGNYVFVPDIFKQKQEKNR
jgi:hypothetical protein